MCDEALNWHSDGAIVVTLTGQKKGLGHTRLALGQLINKTEWPVTFVLSP